MGRAAELMPLLALLPTVAAFGTQCGRRNRALNSPAPRRGESWCCEGCCSAYCSPLSGACYNERKKDYYEACAPKPEDFEALCCSACAKGQYCADTKCSGTAKEGYCLCKGQHSKPSVHPEIPPAEFPPAGTKVAFVGDTGYDSNQGKVYRMIKDWGAEFLIHGGDFDYLDDPALFDRHIEEVFGPDYPYFADIGNHDLPDWEEYKENLERRWKRFGGAPHCAGDYGINMVCNWKGITFVLSGVGTKGSGHVDYIERAFAANPTPWRMCNWHKNQKKMQVGGKSDEVGWPAYEACRRLGAIIATHHEHSYCRSKNLKVTGPDPEVANEDKEMSLFPGQSFVFVSGLGGKSVRVYKDNLEKNPWWAAHAAAEDKVDYGAILCTFHVRGDPRLAECEFRDISGKVWDEWTMRTHNGEKGFEGNLSARPVPQVAEVPAIADFAVGPDLKRTQGNATRLELNAGAGFTFGGAALGGRRVQQARLQVFGAEQGSGAGNVTICGLLPSGRRSAACAEWSERSGADEFGERHEAWVSPDLSGIVNELTAAGAGSITLLVSGSGPSRVVYTSDHSDCMVPHLWVEFPL
eukprot:TRINITY_DN9483_c0_g1_i1.p1 TRINITY_DN9483_c0_g1~~TRINITY_DN9483_c0_g1_i1.p1  ORF type:complete len:605 (+),score=208.48 TRINITY_DN9483_c0_g1_i1:76-1815(+)